MGARLFLLLVHLVVCLSEPALAQAWWNPQWSQRATLTFDNASQAQNLVEFPVLVVLDDATNFDHSTAQASGDDLRFVDADGLTVLAHEIEQWNAAGVSHVWVNVPQIDGGSSADRIWMYWGNATAGSGANPAGTWRSSYVGVFHLTGGETDSSSPSHNGSNQGSIDVPGRIGRANDFDGSNDQIVLPNESAFDFSGAVTVSMWVQIDAFVNQDWDAFVTKGDQTWRIHRCAGGSTVAWSHDWTSGDFGLNRNMCGTVAVDDGNWHYITATYDQNLGSKSIYVNGVLDVSVSEARSFATNGDPVWIGNNSDFTGRSIDGRIDEVRIENVGHTADWIAADYLSVTNTFVEICSPWLGDSDGDGNCDPEDLCPGQDDFLDTDGDTFPDCVDPCPFDNPDDTDGDGVCDSLDPCPLDYLDDADGDGVCDSDDQCPGNPDVDTDGDSVVDCLDPCPTDNPDDTDGDGVCDSVDQCPGVDDTTDSDGDALSDCVDPCPYDNPNDTDGDGVCESVDVCLGFDDALDTDGDGIPNGCDSCALGDSDGDGVPDDCDICPGSDDASDSDLDGKPDGCDPCPTVPDEVDQDGDGWFDCDDCDDTDATINPDGTDVPLNGVDEDCDGADATSEAPGDTGISGGVDTTSGRSWDPVATESARPGASGCRCESTPLSSGWHATLLGVLLVHRRRSRAQDGPQQRRWSSPGEP